MAEREIYVAVGSNVEPERHIPNALSALAVAYDALVRSPAYRSAPAGFEGPDFVNCVVRFRAEVSPEDLILHLKSLEARAGRRRGEANASRQLDLDLILYGDAVFERNGITVPRADILEYAFVLRPLAELAPEAVHPQTGRSFAWHWGHFGGMSLPLHPITF